MYLIQARPHALMTTTIATAEYIQVIQSYDFAVGLTISPYNTFRIQPGICVSAYNTQDLAYTP